MERSGIPIVAVVLVAVALVGVSPAWFAGAAGPASSVGSPTAVPGSHVAPAATASTVTPMLTFPRTVLVETFTGDWCPHCPGETQALHNIGENSSTSVVAISELHICGAPPPSCGDNYVPPDNISNQRASFYAICGAPDVYFDGVTEVCGSTTASVYQPIYQGAIDNASAIPGNVAIAQHAVVGANGVVDGVNITSGITGSYNVMTYLMEYIDLDINTGSGPHNVDWVVRAALHDGPVNLVAGTTTSVMASGPLQTGYGGWNPQKLSVVTFVQQNSTRIVENTNMAPVSTMATSVMSNETTVLSGTTSTITVTAANSSTGQPIAGAQVNLTVAGGGSVDPATGLTAADGTFTTTYTPPNVNASVAVSVNATVTADNYTEGNASAALVVGPWVLPYVPQSLMVAPSQASVTLNWSAPTSGSAGVDYHVFRSTSASGTYAPLGVATLTAFTDTSVVAGQCYWYKVAAQNSFGFSPNTSAASATALTASPVGLPGNVGWWLHLGTANYSAAAGNPIDVYLPSGFFSYTYGPASYAYVADAATGSVTASGSSLTLAADFTPRYANLQGTVSPATANVTVNGSVVPVAAGGTFQELLTAGTYTIVVTAPGYYANTTNVTLTPGNVSTRTITLDAMPASSNPTSTGSGALLSGMDVLILGAVAVAVVAVLAVAVALSRRRRGPGGSL